MAVILNFEVNNVSVCIEELTVTSALEAYIKVIKAIKVEPSSDTKPSSEN